MIKLNTLKNIIKNGGATLNKQNKQVNYKNGYQVSKKDCFTLDLNNLQTILQNTNKLLKTIKQNEFVGLWIDDDKIYIDISIRIANKQKAIKTGLKLNQISIFDWQNQNCIYLKKVED